MDKELIDIAKIVVPILAAILGAYVKLKIQIGILQNDVDNLAFMMGTKRALGENKFKKTEEV